MQTANVIVVSDTQAKVFITELGAYLWVHVVEDAPSVLTVEKTMQWTWLLFLVADRRISKIIKK